MIRKYKELPGYVQSIIDLSNYAFDYAIEFDCYYVLCTESGYRFAIVDKR